MLRGFDASMLIIMPEELNFQDSRPWYKKPWGIPLGLLGIVFLGFLAVFLYNFITIYLTMRANSVAALESRKYQLTASATDGGKVDLSKIYSAAAPTVGTDRPLVNIVEFADFACPYSAEEASVFRGLAMKYSDRVRFTFRFFPVNEEYPDGPQAALAALCAQEQGQFWKMHDILFSHYDALDKDSLYQYAADAGLDINKFQECLQTGKYKIRLQKEVADGVAAGVPGTPTFFVDGEKIPGAIPADIFEQALINLIAQKKL